MRLEEWRKLLSYDPITGEFRWLIKPSAKVYVGDIAGSVNPRGYRRISVYGVTYLAHRLAWLLFYGDWPSGHIDHANGQRDDNRMCNLRLATQSQNCCNRKRHQENKSGFKGVVRRKYGWEAAIMYKGKWQSLGHFKSPESAHAAYIVAAKELHGEFARGE